jgi:hypothetical protein
MRILFNKEDRELVTRRLENVGIIGDEDRVYAILSSVGAALQQQFHEEADYMIHEYEAYV